MTAAAAASMPRNGGARVLKRKTSHSVIERRRREKINEGLIHLQDTVPACRLELRELLECKVRSKKKAKNEDEVQLQVDKLLKDKSDSEMVLEKLCIISHTVDYVQKLQNKVDAYRQWCRCSPPLPDTPQSNSHDKAHTPSSGLVATQEEGCSSCLASLTGKRHWGSNHPLLLSRATAGVPVREDSEEVRGIRRSHRQLAAAAGASISQDIGNLVQCDCDNEEQSSDLELEEWHQPHRRALATAHVCDADHDCARLGLLAHVSAEKERVPSP